MRRFTPTSWIFDTHNQDIYPLTSGEFWAVINALRRAPSVALIREQDGYMVFQVSGAFEKVPK